MISRTNKNDHITPVLKELHLLPINSRITYKILLFSFKALNGRCPSYLSSLLHPCDARYNLRSVSHNRLKEPKSKLCNYVDLSLSLAAPRLWNSLPNQIICFYAWFLKKTTTQNISIYSALSVLATYVNIMLPVLLYLFC